MELRLTRARISFANGLYQASSAVAGGVPKYNCDFIIGPDTKVEKKTADGKWVETTLAAAEKEVALEAFKGDKKKADAWFATLDARQRSHRNGDLNLDKAGDVRNGYEGCWYLHPTSKTRMPIYRADKSVVAFDGEGNPINNPIYSGCYVNARVSLYANLVPGKKGVFASLGGTQYAGEGAAFGGGRAADDDDFEDVSTGADAGDFADMA